MLSLYFSMDFTKRAMTKNEKYGLLYLGSKVYLGSCTALLQLSGKYVPTYLGRSEILKKTYADDFPQLYKILPNLPKGVDIVVINESPYGLTDSVEGMRLIKNIWAQILGKQV